MTERARPAGGLGAIGGTLRAVARTSPWRAAQALLRLNQEGGFNCPGCAWPEEAARTHIDLCENGVKHVAHEVTRRRVGTEFFAEWPIDKLLGQSDQWLESQGRLVEPVIRRRESDRYEPIAWPAAFERIAESLLSLSSPNDAVFYTSGRTSNEAAFLYQLLARQFGTNNLPDCSNMCHESSGTGLSQVIGVGKGTVGLDDFGKAKAIFIIGQNPGSNHPRMFSALLAAKRRGCKIVSINPLKERALVRFAHPQEVLGLLGNGTEISDLYLQVRVGGDVALLKGIMKEVLAAEARSPGRVLDWAFIRSHTEGFERFLAALDAVSFDDLVRESGISRNQMREAAAIYLDADRVIACWAMGLTQHKHGVANVQETANLLFLRGNIGKPGAGVCPVRGHSNVQGDRTMGIWDRPKPEFLSRLSAEFQFQPPAAHGFDTVHAIRAMHEGRAKVFVAMGGNFLMASPDTAYTEEALRRCRLTVAVATTLNRTHLTTGEEGILLPCLGRSEADVQEGGAQFVTVEDSMSQVHRSQGRLKPASSELKSEPAIVGGLARALFGGGGPVAWDELVANYDRIRDVIARVVPGFEDFNRRVREPGGFRLPSGAQTRRFTTPSGKAVFTALPLPHIELGDGEFLMMTIRSHDQFNTTIYGQDDRYRGITGNRRVVLLHPDDIAAEGLSVGERVDLQSRFAEESRRVEGFEVVAYDVPRRCAAMYYPEANPLVPLGSVADGSNTPTYKSVRIVIKRRS
ncbi:MAG: FdhF/YdeP family oxidoreductase [Candidatus Binatia bacterium]|jgi:molybdopterin-dependent oxidoreductase alpha subunit